MLSTVIRRKFSKPLRESNVNFFTLLFHDCNVEDLFCEKFYSDFFKSRLFFTFGFFSIWMFINSILNNPQEFSNIYVILLFVFDVFFFVLFCVVSFLTLVPLKHIFYFQNLMFKLLGCSEFESAKESSRLSSSTAPREEENRKRRYVEGYNENLVVTKSKTGSCLHKIFNKFFIFEMIFVVLIILIFFKFSVVFLYFPEMDVENFEYFFVLFIAFKFLFVIGVKIRFYINMYIILTNFFITSIFFGLRIFLFGLSGSNLTSIEKVFYFLVNIYWEFIVGVIILGYTHKMERKIRITFKENERRKWIIKNMENERMKFKILVYSFFMDVFNYHEIEEIFFRENKKGRKGKLLVCFKTEKKMFFLMAKLGVVGKKGGWEGLSANSVYNYIINVLPVLDDLTYKLKFQKIRTVDERYIVMGDLDQKFINQFSYPLKNKIANKIILLGVLMQLFVQSMDRLEKFKEMRRKGAKVVLKIGIGAVGRMFINLYTDMNKVFGCKIFKGVNEEIESLMEGCKEGQVNVEESVYVKSYKNFKYHLMKKNGWWLVDVGKNGRDVVREQILEELCEEICKQNEWLKFAWDHELIVEERGIMDVSFYSTTSTTLSIGEESKNGIVERIESEENEKNGKKTNSKFRLWGSKSGYIFLIGVYTKLFLNFKFSKFKLRNLNFPLFVGFCDLGMTFYIVSVNLIWRNFFTIFSVSILIVFISLIFIIIILIVSKKFLKRFNFVFGVFYIVFSIYFVIVVNFSEDNVEKWVLEKVWFILFFNCFFVNFIFIEYVLILFIYVFKLTFFKRNFFMEFIWILGGFFIFKSSTVIWILFELKMKNRKNEKELEELGEKNNNFLLSFSPKRLLDKIFEKRKKVMSVLEGISEGFTYENAIIMAIHCDLEFAEHENNIVKCLEFICKYYYSCEVFFGDKHVQKLKSFDEKMFFYTNEIKLFEMIKMIRKVQENFNETLNEEKGLLENETKIGLKIGVHICDFFVAMTVTEDELFVRTIGKNYEIVNLLCDTCTKDSFHIMKDKIQSKFVEDQRYKTNMDIYMERKIEYERESITTYAIKFKEDDLYIFNTKNS